MISSAAVQVWNADGVLKDIMTADKLGWGKWGKWKKRISSVEAER